MKGELIELLDNLKLSGVDFSASIPVPGGGRTVFLEPQDVIAFINDRADWFARRHGATKEDYLAWVESDGEPRCGAQTKDGKRCKNPVSGGVQREFLDWLQEESGFCTVHGGAGSERVGRGR